MVLILLVKKKKTKRTKNRYSRNSNKTKNKLNKPTLTSQKKLKDRHNIPLATSLLSPITAHDQTYRCEYWVLLAPTPVGSVSASFWFSLPTTTSKTKRISNSFTSSIVYFLGGIIGPLLFYKYLSCFLSILLFVIGEGNKANTTIS